MAAGACLFIRIFLPETLSTPKPFRGTAEFIRDILPWQPCGRCDRAQPHEQSEAGCSSDFSEPSIFDPERVDQPQRQRQRSSRDHGDGGYGCGLFCGRQSREAAHRWAADSSVDYSATLPSQRRCTLVIILALELSTKVAWGSSALTNNYQFTVMHFLQEERIYVSLLSRAAAIAAAVVAAILIPRLGPKWSLGMGTLLATLAPLAFIALPGKSGAYQTYHRRTTACRSEAGID